MAKSKSTILDDFLGTDKWRKRIDGLSNDKIFKVLIRIKDKANIHRIFYFAFTGRRFILLHGFTKKTERTPIREIEIAVKRMEDFLARRRYEHEHDI